MSFKTEQSMIAARACGLERTRGAGLDPKHQILNNEASEKYKAAITNSGMTYQLVPTDDQRRNIAEKEIHFWKDHLAAVLSGTSATSPIHLLYQVIPQAERQILLLHQSNTNPEISSYAHIYGAHNYSMHPFFPIDMETLVHDKPLRRKTWAEHATNGWVLGTSPENYRCCKIAMQTTHATRISGTVFFKHKYLTNPAVTPIDTIIAAAHGMATQIWGHMFCHISAENPRPQKPPNHLRGGREQEMRWGPNKQLLCQPSICALPSTRPQLQGWPLF